MSSDAALTIIGGGPHASGVTFGSYQVSPQSNEIGSNRHFHRSSPPRQWIHPLESCQPNSTLHIPVILLCSPPSKVNTYITCIMLCNVLHISLNMTSQASQKKRRVIFKGSVNS